MPVVKSFIWAYKAPCLISASHVQLGLIENTARLKEAALRDKTYAVRGEYCKGMLSCKDYPGCLDCNKFYPIFQGVDPGRMEQWTI